MPGEEREKSKGTSRGHKRFFESLTPEENVLLTVREELYGGSWDSMLEDLRARLEGKPYIFRLATRIEDDIARIERLRLYEREHGIDLGTFAKE